MTDLFVLIYFLLCAVLLQLLRWEFARQRAERRASLEALRHGVKSGTAPARNENLSLAGRLWHLISPR